LTLIQAFIILVTIHLEFTGPQNMPHQLPFSTIIYFFVEPLELIF